MNATTEERVIKAHQLEIGMEIKLADGEFLPIEDLMAANLGGSVAIFFEESEGASVIPVTREVTVR